ncbi:glycosyltransferase family 90 protein [Jaapia argillacea MUCL 33604]|uniref:Glycosyltransferase family 90 protein n=1 Tax=Jaapia argillacea MUCL 33604 TaxID=933084 RepID=A0A067Q8D8_9AGAM|nr:glycosyltransferase family 90 protein [Jaapia argillacea MUCL 33604]
MLGSFGKKDGPYHRRSRSTMAAPDTRNSFGRKRRAFLLAVVFGLTVLLGLFFKNLVEIFLTDIASRAAPTQPHEFASNGLLVVNPEGRHPILDLIERAESDWDEKLKRASKSFDEAVLEYKRRYGRAPPKGFDHWWEYVQEHNVQLPDEYDQIFLDLEPFWGVKPADLHALMGTHLENTTESYTVVKSEGNPELMVLAGSLREDQRQGHLETAYLWIDLLNEVQHHLPPFKAVFSPRDNPRTFGDQRIKSMATTAAAEKRHIDIHNLPPAQRLGWRAACKLSSPSAKLPINFAYPPHPNPHKTFIHNHRLAMDPCLHPIIFHTHGQFLSKGTGPMPSETNELFLPIFAYSSTLLHSDLRLTSMHGFVDDIIPRSDDPAWEHKTDERLSWRGTNTGIFHSDLYRWKSAQRARLVAFADDLVGNLTVLTSPSEEGVDAPVGEGMTIRKALVKPAMLDVAFAGTPLGCDPPTCDKLREMFDWHAAQSFKAAGKHKYVLDMDGNGWSSRFKRSITSNALIFKATVYPEWFTDRIIPWLHYVPVQMDLSDLHDSLIFFRGNLNGQGAHDDLAKRIASAGRTWSKTLWRREDMAAYMFRLFLEYARVTSLDREALTLKV